MLRCASAGPVSKSAAALSGRVRQGCRCLSVGRSPPAAPGKHARGMITLPYVLEPTYAAAARMPGLAEARRHNWALNGARSHHQAVRHAPASTGKLALVGIPPRQASHSATGGSRLRLNPPLLLSSLQLQGGDWQGRRKQNMPAFTQTSIPAPALRALFRHDYAQAMQTARTQMRHSLGPARSLVDCAAQSPR